MGGAMRLFAIAVVTTLVLSIGEAAAQGRQLQIVVEDLDRDAAQCGLTERAIREVATVELRRAQIAVASDANPVLSIEPIVLSMVLSPSKPHCVFSLVVSVVYVDTARTRGRFRSNQGFDNVHLCNRHSLGAEETAVFAREFSKIVAQQIGECLSELN